MFGPGPYVLLDDATVGGAAAQLYRDPVRVVVAHEISEVSDALAAMRSGIADGLHAAGFVAYDAAPAFGLVGSGDADGPLVWLGMFEGYETLPDDWATALPDPAGAWTGAPVPTIERDAYEARFVQVRALIAAGDIYQANLTIPATVPIVGDPLAVYARLRRQAGAGYGAIVDTGDRLHLSLSPELFFAVDGSGLTCRPMKGTALRGDTPDEDRRLAHELARDTKQRAENLMIVDLMRNDLARVATAGSVAVPSLFAVETYPTVHQMTSTVTATLAPGHDAVDVLAALFPCGSITGAPKRRATEVIAQVERRQRGLYCGAIGRFDARTGEGGGDAMFNVAIRTLTVERDGSATMGLGSGIVSDSRADDEWRECLAKGAFVATGQRKFDLFETMRFDPDDGLALLDRHLARMTASAALFGFTFDRHHARNELQAATFRLRRAARVRLLLARSGAVAIEVAPLPLPATEPLSVAVVPLPVAPSDFRLRHKTSDRGFYDRARNEAGADEVVFEDPCGFLTEGSFTSLFVASGDRLLTPPLVRGLLPGVLRAKLISTGRAIERDLTCDDLINGFFVGNALRGLMPARLRL